jgi:hypothetical protein
VRFPGNPGISRKYTIKNSTVHSKNQNRDNERPHLPAQEAKENQKSRKSIDKSAGPNMIRYPGAKKPYQDIGNEEGARAARRTIEKEIESLIVQAILKQPKKKQIKLEMTKTGPVVR